MGKAKHNFRSSAVVQALVSEFEDRCVALCGERVRMVRGSCPVLRLDDDEIDDLKVCIRWQTKHAARLLAKAAKKVATFAPPKAASPAKGYSPNCYAERTRVQYGEQMVSGASSQLAYANAFLTLRRLELTACLGGVVV